MRYYYSNNLTGFFNDSPQYIVGVLSQQSGGNIQRDQVIAWTEQIEIIRNAIGFHHGEIFFEYSIPRMGRRIDVVIVTDRIVFVIEFKVGAKKFESYAIDQVWDYALDLKNFHKTSHNALLAPILVATEAAEKTIDHAVLIDADQLIRPLRTNASSLRDLLSKLQVEYSQSGRVILDWAGGAYQPTPTIIEAATALYNQHSVKNITRNDAGAKNLAITTEEIGEVIMHARQNDQKAICFVTGVPGAGKTLVGLDVATKHLGDEHKSGSVFLSGNGPLVAVLREALAIDAVRRAKEKGARMTKGESRSRVKAFVQNVHHYRDEGIANDAAPFDHIAIFDEAQRAWDQDMTASFMKRKKGIPDFMMSEPEFLISCLERHKDWAVIVCLVGSGQEINRGEAGIAGWIDAINKSFPEWTIYMSDHLADDQYSAGQAIQRVKNKDQVEIRKDLHLSISMRSYRAENLSNLITAIIDRNLDDARREYAKLKNTYPIHLTRSVEEAKNWLRARARGTERYGMVVSSSAYRLRPFGIDVRPNVDPVNWFLNDKEDIRSSYFLEDVATEFQVQGLELDWTCVTWDADFRFGQDDWETFSFVGDKWQKVNKEERRQYLKNAYRVLLTRARQGMVIVVPAGSDDDKTRKREFYDGTYRYLTSAGLGQIN